MHLHTDAGVAVSAMQEGLLPITQHALFVYHDTAYHDWEGVALDLISGAQGADLGYTPNGAPQSRHSRPGWQRWLMLSPPLLHRAGLQDSGRCHERHTEHAEPKCH